MNNNDIERIINESGLNTMQVKLDINEVTMDNKSNMNMNILLIIVAIFVTFIIARIIARYVFGVNNLSMRYRHTLLLIGLCGSGKTTLFAQLVAQKRISARTSMSPNRGTIKNWSAHHTTKTNMSSSLVSDTNHKPVTVVDFPGHRRLRDSLAPALEEAKNIVLVVDSVTIQDDRHEGAQALAEFVVSVFLSPSFYGVQRVLVACTKRDELTSYSSKAVRKLLEAEITRCITSREGALQSLDNIVNASGVAVGRKKYKSGARISDSGGCAYQMVLGDSGKFTFDDFPVPVHFADISSMIDPDQHSFNVDSVLEFLEGRM